MDRYALTNERTIALEVEQPGTIDKCQSENPRQVMDPTRPTATYIRWQAAGG
jgi:hypothetical protein